MKAAARTGHPKSAAPRNCSLSLKTNSDGPRETTDLTTASRCMDRVGIQVLRGVRLLYRANYPYVGVVPGR